jgi:hypothetical protein
MKKKIQQASDEIIAGLRRQVAGYEGAMARLCGILGCAPVDPTPETRAAALAAWMAENERKDWSFE